MKKLLFITLLAAVLCLAACTAPAEPTYDTIPTPPSISPEKTPIEMLSAALAQTQNAQSLTLEYRSNGEIIATQQIKAEEDFVPAAQLLRNPDFLTDFCSMNLLAIPSNTGTIRYEVNSLTDRELSALLGVEITTDAECSVALEVDAKGFLTGFSYQAGDISGSITAYNIED